jgi:N-glycosidase YbiA
MTNRGMDTDDRIFFYERDFYCLSNFSSFSLLWSGPHLWSRPNPDRPLIKFDTAEAAYHWEKFPNRVEIQNAILLAPSAHDAFRTARQNDEDKRVDWDDVKVDVMRLILRAKVEQHPYVLTKLLQTGRREIVEDSWRDSFWGWGEDRRGLNMLGQLWMELREKIRADAGRLQETPP